MRDTPAGACASYLGRVTGAHHHMHVIHAHVVNADPMTLQSDHVVKTACACMHAPRPPIYVFNSLGTYSFTSSMRTFLRKICASRSSANARCIAQLNWRLQAAQRMAQQPASTHVHRMTTLGDWQLAGLGGGGPAARC